MMYRHDIIIIGAGPGGLQLGYFLAKKGRNYIILERGEGPGTFFRTLPRSRRLISVNKLHTGYEDSEQRMRFDWNSLLSDNDRLLFKNYSEDYFPHADAMVQYLRDFAERHVPHIQYGCKVDSVRKEAGLFRVVARDGREFSSRIVVVATGVAKPYGPSIPGLELAEEYTEFEPDPERFRNKRVLIIGKGNAGFETADQIIHKAALIHLVSPSPIRFAWNTHYAGHLRALNNNLLDTYQLKIQNAVLDARVMRLHRAQDGRVVVSFAYSHARGETENIVYDHVIACTGFQFDISPFDVDCRPTMTHDNRLPDLTPEFESTNVSGLYFAGALTQSLDYKKTNSAFIHGFRYNARALSLMLDSRFYGAPLPRRTRRLDVRFLCDQILARINRSSAQWQQFGFIGDAVSVEDNKCTYYEDLPIGYIHRSEIGKSGHYYVVTLEFGEHSGDVFSIPRDPEILSAASSTFLHPVVRLYSNGVLIRRHHLLENLFGEWRHPYVHRRPLLEFLEQTLSQRMH